MSEKSKKPPINEGDEQARQDVGDEHLIDRRRFMAQVGKWSTFISATFIGSAAVASAGCPPPPYIDYSDYSDGYADYADYGDGYADYANYGDGYVNYGDYVDYADYVNYGDYADYADYVNYGDYADYADYVNYANW